MKRGMIWSEMLAGSNVECLETGDLCGDEKSSFEQKDLHSYICASKCFLIDVPFLSPKNLE